MMQRDLLDALRCPNDHGETWLVAMVHEARGAELRGATLACPTCGSEFTVDDGVANFGPAPASGDGGIDALAANALAADALAAMLGVAEGATPIVLTGALVAHGDAVRSLVDVPQVWLNAAQGVATLASAQPAAQLTAPHRAPLGAGTMAAAALDGSHAHGAMLDSLVQSVRAGGRIVLPADAALPPTLRAIARDDTWQVAETTAPARGLVTLRRRPPDV